jgi:hypothetical protein
MWQAILDTKALTDRPRPSAATVLKVGHCLAQLSGAYRALVQDSELEARIKALEERANGSP